MPEPASLQIPTLYLTGALSGLLAALILLAPCSLRRGERAAVARFGAALALGAVALAILWLGGHVAGAGPVPLAAAAGIAQVACIAHGSTCLFGGRLPALPTSIALAAVSIAYAAAATLAPPPMTLAVVGAAQAGFCGLAAFRAWRARDPVGAGFRRGFALLYGLIALLTAACGLDALTIAAALRAPTALQAGLNAAAALAWALSPLLTALIVLGLLNARISDRLLKQALTDDLTGVHTRRHLLADAPGLVARLRARGSRAAVMMLDLDHFKRINDLHGHQVGDRVLRHAAATMRKALRADTLLARYGGEEFCAVVPVGDDREALSVAERVRMAVAARPIVLGGQSIRLTVSIGVAVQRGDLRFDELLALADESVYEAKARGRDRVVGVVEPARLSPPSLLPAARTVRPA